MGRTVCILICVRIVLDVENVGKEGFLNYEKVHEKKVPSVATVDGILCLDNVRIKDTNVEEVQVAKGLLNENVTIL